MKVILCNGMLLEFDCRFFKEWYIVDFLSFDGEVFEPTFCFNINFYGCWHDSFDRS